MCLFWLTRKNVLVCFSFRELLVSSPSLSRRCRRPHPSSHKSHYNKCHTLTRCGVTSESPTSPISFLLTSTTFLKLAICRMVSLTWVATEDMISSASKWSNEKVSEWVGEWVIGWVSRWVSGWVREWVSGWVREWGSRWVSGWVSRWVSEWLGGWVSRWVS